MTLGQMNYIPFGIFFARVIGPNQQELLVLRLDLEAPQVQ